jgi:hypothetical protein
VITCFAIDPQTEHMRRDHEPPETSALVTCSCCWQTYRYSGKQITRGAPTPNHHCARRKSIAPKTDGAVLVAASLVAAIRLRGEEIRPSPKLNAVVHDSILLARTILAQIERRDA